MDKYELSIKEDKIKKHAEKKDYAAAVKIADTIDWSKIKNIKMLTLVSQVYEKAKNYAEAKNVLLFAYERVPMGRRMLYKLTELCVKDGKIEEAESYFEEFQKIAPNDIGKLLLAYQIESAKGGEVDKLITILELYRKNEFEEKWAYELAHLYHKAGRVKECVQLCNEIILWFSVGTYVDRALNLKMQYEPLTPSEQEKLVNKKKFEARVRAVEREFEKREYQGVREEEAEAVEKRREQEQLKEVAMTKETDSKEFSLPLEEKEGQEFAAEEISVEEQAFFDMGETPAMQENQTDMEEVSGGKVIPFAVIQSSEAEATSSEAKRLFFTDESFSEGEETVEKILAPEYAEEALGKEADGGELKEQLFDMQESLAQAVQETENGFSDEKETDGDAGYLSQTKEVVKETRKAWRGQTEFLPDPALQESGISGETWPMSEEGRPLPEEELLLPETEPEISREVAPPLEREVAPLPDLTLRELETSGEIRPMSEENSSLSEEELPLPEEESEEPGKDRILSEEAPILEQELPLSEEEPEASEESEPSLKEAHSVQNQEPAAFKQESSSSEQESAVSETVPESFEEGEITCVVVEADPGPGRIPFAVEKLKKTHEVLGSATTQVAKISGAKLSEKGVHNTFKRLAGRDLIVDEAGELSHEAAAELVEEMEHPSLSLVLILVDSTERMDELLVANPELDRLCVYLEEGSQMEIDEFVSCASEYAKEEECVIEEMASLAIYAAAERFRDDGTELTAELAKKLVDEAIDRAEHRGIKGLFGSKYDKEGYLVLKEQFFKNL
ncbi:MAG: hypothetical protein HFI63_08010 [Lachnospiraceae bacterium]|nr:hypothetical protein [Lachnospiraceae bacterium]